MTIAEPVRTAMEKPGIRGLLAGALKKYSIDRASRMGAAIAYYAIFALAPLILVAVGVAGLILSEEAARGEIVDLLTGTVGRESATFVEGMVASAGGGAGIGGAVVGAVLSLIAASAVAAQLKGALDTVWDVPAEQRTGLLATLKTRGKGLVVVLGSGAILFAIMATSAAIAGLEEIAGSRQLALVLDFADPVLSLTFGALAFTFMFRYLPASRVAWREAAVGGTATAVMFAVGSLALSRYIGTGAVGQGFGAAAALVVLLVFVHYSAQIVLFGAEVARVYGLRRDTPAPTETLPLADRGAESPMPAPKWALIAFIIGLLIGRRR